MDEAPPADEVPPAAEAPAEDEASVVASIPPASTTVTTGGASPSDVVPEQAAPTPSNTASRRVIDARMEAGE